MSDEPRTIREARQAIREAESAVERIHMSPAASQATLLGWYLRRARLALRQAEIHAAKADDPRLERLDALSPHLGPPRPRTTPPRKRYRCSTCFVEQLFQADHIERHPSHEPLKREGDEWVRYHCGDWQPVPRLPKGVAA